MAQFSSQLLARSSSLREEGPSRSCALGVPLASSELAPYFGTTSFLLLLVRHLLLVAMHYDALVPNSFLLLYGLGIGPMFFPLLFCQTQVAYLDAGLSGLVEHKKISSAKRKSIIKAGSC